MKKFPHFKQYDSMDCGPTCLKMIAKFFGKDYSLEFLRKHSYITKAGVNLSGISEASEKIGLRSLAVKIDTKKLTEDAPLPCILHWNQNHFVVLYAIRKRRRNIFSRKESESLFLIADPANGLQAMETVEFEKYWLGKSKEGACLLLEPTVKFFETEPDETFKKTKGFEFLFKYFIPYKKYFYQLLISLLIGSGLSLIFPFLTQVLVDNGINQNNPGFVVLILLAQLSLFIGTTAIELIRSWLFLHINSRINISIISDFLIKLMQLPISFFDTKLVGDIQQRIGDHNRVQSFLTGSALSTLFSMVNLLVFTLVLSFYSGKILAVFMFFSAISILWIILFLKQRKKLDYIRFQRMSENQNVLYEMITAMQEIKLNNCETDKRWEWERVQAKLYKLNVRSLSLGQHQQMGSVFLNRLKNIIITYISAVEVMNGSMTLGMMMSVSYITGQLSAPIDGILGFIQNAQDARISLDRLSEIHNKDDEEKTNSLYPSLDGLNHETVPSQTEEGHSNLDNIQGIKIENLSFQYQGEKSKFVLKDLNLFIPKGKVTAIVGTSGSGKTTLMKLLLNYYKPTKGSILINSVDLSEISPRYWRSKCGTVMQEGHIFSDTISGNICLKVDEVNQQKLKEAVDIANIRDFIEGLPLNYNTMIGNSGNGISAGQRQRILIARSVYKSPEFLFFDEATSALDANNEKEIIGKLERFYEGKTVIIIAHRLSTVKHADQIVVLENGELIEIGNHNDLLNNRGRYYELVKNQLEISS